ncbi:hypothetical protein ACFLT8_00295 [Chloroflexota bacterium]
MNIFSYSAIHYSEKETSLTLRVLNSELQTGYIVELLYPQVNEIWFSFKKLSNSQPAQIIAMPMRKASEN